MPLYGDRNRVLVSENDLEEQTLVEKIVPGNGVIVTELNDGDVETLEISVPPVEDDATVQRRSNADFAIPGSFTDMPFQVTDVENDDTIVESDGANNDRIIVLETGLYQIGYRMSVDRGGETATTADGRVRVNDTTILEGSEHSVRVRGAGGGRIAELGVTFFAELTANDFLTVQVNRSSACDALAGAIFTVTRCKGRKGADGLDGVDGADGADGAPGPAGSGSNINVAEEGSTLVGGPFDLLNFVGSNVTATDAGSGQVNITVTGSTRDDFSAYDSAGTQTFTGATTTINLDTERFASSATYTLASDEVTINVTDRYKVTIDVTLKSDSGGRTQVDSFLEINASEQAGTRMTHYCRQSPQGSSASMTAILDLTSGNVLRIRAIRVDGSGTISPQVNGTRMTIERLS